MTLTIHQINAIAEGRALATHHSTEVLIAAVMNRVGGDARIADPDAGRVLAELTALFSLLTEPAPRQG